MFKLFVVNCRAAKGLSSGIPGPMQCLVPVAAASPSPAESASDSPGGAAHAPQGPACTPFHTLKTLVKLVLCSLHAGLLLLVCRIAMHAIDLICTHQALTVEVGFVFSRRLIGRMCSSHLQPTFNQRHGVNIFGRVSCEDCISWIGYHQVTNNCYCQWSKLSPQAEAKPGA